MIGHGLPSFPLVPVSSSQAVIGAVIGVGIIKGIRGIKYRILGEVAIGWVITPIVAGIITFISLFFLQNVFNQEVYHKQEYKVDESVNEYLEGKGIYNKDLPENIVYNHELQLKYKYIQVSKSIANRPGDPPRK